MPNLEKNYKYLIYTQTFCYTGYEISANYLFFSASNLIEIKQYQLWYPTVELAKLSMRNDYVSLKFIKSKFK